ncbi:hypothetical protein YP76_15980 [Sphingobium chungbukense]|uniref:Uncharacterized protein n=1 Tax=Sphingobium chungbukense TaxID=56193 RepID=A0A0M3ARD2_9SPHN|nr:hypothetical protein YP76_15980 [Sphingobium chungbukense]
MALLRVPHPSAPLRLIADGQDLDSEDQPLSGRFGLGFRALAYESLPCRNPRFQQVALWGFMLSVGSAGPEMRADGRARAAERQGLGCAKGVFAAMAVMMPRADTGPAIAGRMSFG